MEKKYLNLNVHTIYLVLKHNITTIKLRWSDVSIDYYRYCIKQGD